MTIPYLPTQRQREVLALIAGGATTKEIARELRISMPTVKWHVSVISRHLGARSRAEAVAIAVARGFINPRLRSEE